MKKIYILHEYLTPTHFFALYDQEIKQNKYIIEDYIIISHLNLIKFHVKEVIKTKKIIKGIKNYIRGLKKIYDLKFISDATLIVGIAPYNKLIKKYKKVLKKNNSIYFSSFTEWEKFNIKIHDTISRKEFFEILNNSMNGIAGVSNETIQGISRYSPLKTSSVKHSIAIEKYKKKDLEINKYKEKGDLRLLYLGQFIKRKNVHVLLEWLKKTDLEVQVDFAGNGILENELLKFEKKLKNINMLGKISKNEVMEKIRNYDYLILPSEEEPFGIVLLEALASGVPCIVSNAVGPKEIIRNGETGFVIEDELTIDSLEKIIKEILKIDFQTYKQLSYNSILESKTYSSSNIIKKWEKLL